MTAYTLIVLYLIGFKDGQNIVVRDIPTLEMCQRAAASFPPQANVHPRTLCIETLTRAARNGD
jgi:hypothetical protein